MTPNQARICREISNRLEPWPNENTVIWSRGDSPKHFWKRYHDKQSDPSDGWNAVNFFESEDASARLLEVMPSAELIHDSERAGTIDEWCCFYNPQIVGLTARTRKEAIVLAACKWLGISEEA